MWLWQLIQIMSSKFSSEDFNRFWLTDSLSDLFLPQWNTQFSAALWTRSSTAAMTVTGDSCDRLLSNLCPVSFENFPKTTWCPTLGVFTIPMDVPAGCYIFLSICTYPVSKIHVTPKYEQAPRAPLYFYARLLFIYVANFLFALVGSLHFTVVDLERETETEIFVSYERFTCLLRLPCAFGPPSYLHWIVE